MDTITILQHNGLNWETRKFDLINIYSKINLHIILLNSHGNNESNNIKIPGYNCYRKSTRNEKKRRLSSITKERHKLQNRWWFLNRLRRANNRHYGRKNIHSDILFPTKTPISSYPDFHRLIYNNHPTYITGDLNASHVSGTITTTQWPIALTIALTGSW